MAYKFKYKDLENLANDIKANAKEQLAALSQAEAVIKRLTQSDAMAGNASDQMKGYFASTYGTVIPTMKLLISNHAKNCLLYIKAYDAKRMGGNTAIDWQELNEVYSKLNKNKANAGNFFSDDNSTRTNGEFTDALEAKVEAASLHHDPKEESRDLMMKLIKETKEDIKAIEDYYKNIDGATGEFASADKAFKSLNVLFQERHSAGDKIEDFMNYGEDFWASTSGKSLRNACIDLYWEAEAKQDFFGQDDMKISDDEITPMAFEERTNGDDLYSNPYYNPPFNLFKHNGKEGGNCTWYAWGRFQEAQGFTERDPNLDMNGNAEDWWTYANNHGYETGQAPRPGAIMVWTYTDGRSAGHVAFVERVDKDGTVHTTESGYRSGYFWTDSYDSKGTRYHSKFLGYIYPKKSAPIQMSSDERDYYESLKSSNKTAGLADLQTHKKSAIKVPAAKDLPKEESGTSKTDTSAHKGTDTSKKSASTQKTTDAPAKKPAQTADERSTPPKQASKTTAEGVAKGSKDVAKQAEKAAKEIKKEVEQTSKQETYTVKKGDTLWDIAQEHGVDYHDIAKDNNIENPSLIHPGEEFVINTNN